MRRNPTMPVWLMAAAVMLLGAGEALALKARVDVAPKSAEALGFKVTSEKRKDGMVRWTVTRDLSKARAFPAESELELRRNSNLRVYGPGEGEGLIVECQVVPQEEKEGSITYSFTLSPAHAAHAFFTVVEVDDYKDRTRERLLGGGTFFEFKLSEFVKAGEGE